MDFEGKKNTDKWFPVKLVDDTDFKTAETGKVFGDVTAKYAAEGATSLTTYTVATADWKEAGNGLYWLNIGASEFTAEGKYEVNVTCSGCLAFDFIVEVRDRTIAEWMDTPRLGLSLAMDGSDLIGGVWVEDAGGEITSVNSLGNVKLYNANTGAEVASLTVGSADARGVYAVSRTSFTPSSAVPYVARAEVEIVSGGATYSLKSDATYL